MKPLWLVVACFICVMSADARAKEIPLDQIWALKMPGTRDIEELTSDGSPLLDSILTALTKSSSWPRGTPKSMPGFAVSGEGQELLQQAHAVLVDGQKQSELFTTDDEVSLVFFSQATSGRYTNVRQVKRDENKIEVQYRYEPYIASHVWSTFAIIPLGKLPAGRYQVEFTKLPMDQKSVQLGFSSSDDDRRSAYLCKPFSFRVSQER